MTDDCRQQLRRARRIPFPKLAIVAVIIAGAALASACSQPSDTQQAQQQQQAPDEQARKEADEKAWADAEKAGTAAAYTAYIQNFGGGAHVSEASQRIVALNEAARKAADPVRLRKSATQSSVVSTAWIERCRPSRRTTSYCPDGRPQFDVVVARA